MEELIIKISFIIIGLILIILSLPLLYKKIRPNYFYGFRMKKTLENKEIWYKANQFMSKDMLIAGFIILITSFIFFFIETSITNLIIFELIILITSVNWVIIRAFLYLKRL